MVEGLTLTLVCFILTKTPSVRAVSIINNCNMFWKKYLIGFLVGIAFFAVPVIAAPPVKKVAATYIFKAEYDKKIGEIETRLKAVEAKENKVIVLKGNSGVNIDVSDLDLTENSDYHDFKTTVRDFQSCLRRWSIGNEFMKADDVYHCAIINSIE